MTDQQLLGVTDAYLNATAALLDCVSRRAKVDLEDVERLAAARDEAEAAYLAVVRAP